MIILRSTIINPVFLVWLSPIYYYYYYFKRKMSFCSKSSLGIFCQFWLRTKYKIQIYTFSHPSILLGRNLPILSIFSPSHLTIENLQNHFNFEFSVFNFSFFLTKFADKRQAADPWYICTYRVCFKNFVVQPKWRSSRK